MNKIAKIVIFLLNFFILQWVFFRIMKVEEVEQIRKDGKNEFRQYYMYRPVGLILPFSGWTNKEIFIFYRIEL